MKFRKQPVVIDAVQWTGNNVTEVLEFSAGETSIYLMDGDLAIETMEGRMHASVGDWIIKGVQGEFYPCKPDIFAATYEDATEPVVDGWQRRWDCLVASLDDVLSRGGSASDWVQREMSKLDPRCVPHETDPRSVHGLATGLCQKLLDSGFGGIRFYDAAVAPSNSLEDYDGDIAAHAKHCRDYAIFTVEYERPLFDDFDDNDYVSTPAFDEHRFEQDLLAHVRQVMGDDVKVTFRSGCSEFECERRP